MFIQALLTLFLSGGLFFVRARFNNRLLALYFCIFALEILYFLYATTKIYTLYPFLYGRFYFSFGVLYGPLLFLHFQSVVFRNKRLQRLDLLHLVPLLLLNAVMFKIIVMPNMQRVLYFANEENFYNYVLNLNYFRAAHQFVYGILLFLFFRKYFSTLTVNQKFYLGGMSIIYLVTTIAISMLTLFANSWNDFSWYYVLCNMFVLLIGYILYRDPKFFKALKAKYEHSTLNEKNMEVIKSKIEDLFKSEKVYLQNDLSLDKVGAVLNIKPYHISQTLSYLLRENFNDFVNTHRIAHAKKLMILEDYENYKIEAIALESGFNNKVTFYKAFAKLTKTTPSQFRKTQKKRKQ